MAAGSKTASSGGGWWSSEDATTSAQDAVRYHTIGIPRQGRISRTFDRVKRPMFMGFFVMCLLGGLAGHLPLFIAGTLGFTVVGGLHALQRSSTVPLLGNYVGVGRFLRVTRAGRVVIVLTLIAGMAAVNMAINLLLLVLGMLLGAILISGILSENSLRRVRVRTFMPTTVFAGEPFPLRLTVMNGKKRLPSYSLTFQTCFAWAECDAGQGMYVAKVPADGRVVVTRKMVLESRGRHRAEQIRVATQFPFGLAEKWSYCPAEEEVVVYPALGRLLRPVVPVSQRLHWKGSGQVLNKTGQDEFWGLREYRDGDNPRHIHWRSTARLGKKLVREYHREQAEKVCILLDVDVPMEAGEEAWRRWEEAVSFAATLSVHYLGRGYEVGLAAGGVKIPADRGNRQYRKILGTLAEIEGDGQTFTDLVNGLDYRFLRDSYVVAILLDGERFPYSTLAQLQEHRQTVRVIDVSAEAFHNIFQAPDALKQCAVKPPMHKETRTAPIEKETPDAPPEAEPVGEDSP